MVMTDRPGVTAAELLGANPSRLLTTKSWPTGFDLLDRSGARGAVLFLTSGETVALPRTLEWLA